jgi:aconitate hydratase
MGIVPLQYLEGQTASSLGLTGKETYSIEIPQDVQPGQLAQVKVIIISKKQV